jgi:hypothetical protein
VITGRRAKYKDPQTGLGYSSLEAFRTIRSMMENGASEYVWNPDLEVWVGNEGEGWFEEAKEGLGDDKIKTTNGMEEDRKEVTVSTVANTKGKGKESDGVGPSQTSLPNHMPPISSSKLETLSDPSTNNTISSTHPSALLPPTNASKSSTPASSSDPGNATHSNSKPNLTPQSQTQTTLNSTKADQINVAFGIDDPPDPLENSASKSGEKDEPKLSPEVVRNSTSPNDENSLLDSSSQTSVGKDQGVVVTGI